MFYADVMARKGFKPWQELSLGIATVAVIGYAVLSLAPMLIAPLVPQRVWNTLGAVALEGLTGGAGPCSAGGGPAALSALVARLGEGGNEIPAVTVSAYPISVLNAWAVPGGTIVLTSELIAEADTAEEVAGVLAHEIGHIREHHAETQVVRELGIGILAGLGSGGGMATSMAILRYSRDDEREADAIALEIVHRAAIDPAGLRSFFGKIQLQEGGEFPGKIGNMMQTHPMTRERIDAVRPLPAGVVARAALSAGHWAALKGICSVKQDFSD